MRYLLCLMLLAVLLPAALCVSPARADDWDEDEVIRSRDKDNDEEEAEDPEEVRRRAYDNAADPEHVLRDDEDRDKDGEEGGRTRMDAGELGGYFGLGEDMEGAEVEFVPGEGYIVTYPDGTTRKLRKNDSNLRGTHAIDAREGRETGNGYDEEERAGRAIAAGTRPEGSDDGGASSEEQVWGPLWGVPAEAEILKDYPGELNPYVDENGRILDPTQRDLAVNVETTDEADATEADDETVADDEDDEEGDGDKVQRRHKINRKDPNEW